jgi:hypothetical protein
VDRGSLGPISALSVFFLSLFFFWKEDVLGSEVWRLGYRFRRWLAIVICSELKNKYRRKSRSNGQIWMRVRGISEFHNSPPSFLWRAYRHVNGCLFFFTEKAKTPTRRHTMRMIPSSFLPLIISPVLPISCYHGYIISSSTDTRPTIPHRRSESFHTEIL